MSKKSKKLSCNESFKVGDLVGAKIKGYPIWPAKVVNVESVNKKAKITVKFFGTEETGSSFIQLKHFADLTETERKCNRKQFQEALDLCQSEFDSSIAGDDIAEAQEELKDPTCLKLEDSTKPVPQRKAKRKRVEEAELKDVKPEKKIKVEKLDEPMLETASVDDINNTIANDASITTDDQISPTLNTIRKLKEKIAEKLKEKDKLKRITKDQRISDKVCAKFKVFSLRLKNFARVLEDISKLNSLTEQDDRKLKESVRNYLNILPPLNICVQHFMNGKNKMKNLNDCQDCHQRLREIEVLTRRDDSRPEKLRKELRMCRKKMKSNGALLDFINEEFESVKNSIIERKENGSEKGTF